MEVTIKLPAGADRVSVLGTSDRNMKMIREALGVTVTVRDGQLRVRGDRAEVATARRVVERIAGAASTTGRAPTRAEVLNIIADESAHLAGRAIAAGLDEGRTSAGDRGLAPPASLGWSEEDQADAPSARPERREWDGTLDVFVRGRRIRPKTGNQDRYIHAIRDNDLVFSIGPAGTGKTYLAVAAAVHLLRTDRCAKVILCRPAVEAGEKLGFLPGDLEAKVNPYLRPLFDALNDMVEYATLRRFMESDVVEVCPLAFMRGRTLNNSVIILDEAQNTTRGQMKMFLTRMGNGSRMIVTGDTTQIDLPDPRQSGLIDAARRLSRTPGVGFVTLDRGDVVRHPLVQRVIDAYGEDDAAGPGESVS
ncbi:MAG: hypothetical protein AMXMBFR58_37190 [Phycisphaerae bacterium]|nr:PhoH-like protein [Phycisphaerales bacterium]MCK6476826.1 PhoH family protein [Phycisphaerales bacterium]